MLLATKAEEPIWHIKPSFQSESLLIHHNLKLKFLPAVDIYTRLGGTFG